MIKACKDHFYDSRGSLHKIQGIPSDFSIKQVIVSKTLKAWTVRGLHYSSPPMEESKIISCIKGKLAWLCIQKNKSEILHYQLYELSEKDKTAKFNVSYDDKRALMDVATDFNTRFFVN